MCDSKHVMKDIDVLRNPKVPPASHFPRHFYFCRWKLRVKPRKSLADECRGGMDGIGGQDSLIGPIRGDFLHIVSTSKESFLEGRAPMRGLLLVSQETKEIEQFWFTILILSPLHPQMAGPILHNMWTTCCAMFGFMTIFHGLNRKSWRCHLMAGHECSLSIVPQNWI